MEQLETDIRMLPDVEILPRKAENTDQYQENTADYAQIRHFIRDSPQESIYIPQEYRIQISESSEPTVPAGEP